MSWKSSKIGLFWRQKYNPEPANNSAVNLFVTSPGWLVVSCRIISLVVLWLFWALLRLIPKIIRLLAKIPTLRDSELRDSEDSDHVLVVGGPKERYQDEPLAVDEDNDDSRSWRKCEDDDGLLNPVCIRGSIRTASGSCYMVNNAAFL